MSGSLYQKYKVPSQAMCPGRSLKVSKGLQGVIGNYKGLQTVQGVTKDYRRLQRVARCVLHRVQEYTKGYLGL